MLGTQRGDTGEPGNVSDFSSSVGCARTSPVVAGAKHTSHELEGMIYGA